MTAAAPRPPRIVVLADDLIWSSRLVSQLRGAGADPVPVRDEPAFAEALTGSAGAVVDLTARAYDGTTALERARARGVPSIAVGQHDDAPTRRSARAAGASKVYAYQALFEQGPRVMAAWLAQLAATDDEERR